MAENDAAPVEERFEIKVIMIRKPEGDYMNIECDPRLFPDYVATALFRAYTFYQRKLQAVEVLQAMQDAQRAAQVMRGVRLS